MDWYHILARIQEELGEGVEHEVRPCTANPVEQSHRRIKHRYYPVLGFGEFKAAQRFCQAVDEVKNFLRTRNQMGELVLLSDRRNRFLEKIQEFRSLILLCYKYINRQAKGTVFSRNLATQF